MQILQVPEARKMVKAYRDGYITVKELREDLEWYWDIDSLCLMFHYSAASGRFFRSLPT
jgi:hypothetical protein